MPILLATSSASKSGVSRTYAFLLPSGLISVLIFLVWMSYSFCTASLICFLVAFVAQMNTCSKIAV